ncbi:MAG TPA: SH3 domain-containing protein [Chthoniobacterales bacterium]|nr:SH3 domain-containing protein [Chthoniobacterales bacterium]
MRLVSPVAVGLALVSLLCPISDGADTEISKPFPPYRLRPVDDSSRDPEFRKFYAKLLSAIERKDHGFLISIVDPKIELSFGGDAGISRFKEMWKPTERKSPIWNELGEALRLGVTFDAKQGEFWAPYVFSRFPENYDGFDYSVIIAKEVKVRQKPKSSAPVLATLSYEIVRTNYSEFNDAATTGKPQWIKVGLSDGREGFVPAAMVRSPIDYRAGFAKKEGKWMMTVFIAGD